MVQRTWKIKLKNGHIYKDIFQKWFFDYKYAYNKCNWFKNETTAYYSKLDLRDLITPKEVNQHIPWFLETPKDIRADAVFENCKNWKSAFSNLKNNNIKHFEMGYLKKRTKKHHYCFGLPGSAIKVIRTNKSYDDRKRIVIYPSYTNDFQLHLSEKIPVSLLTEKDYLLSSHKIIFDGINYYLHVSIDRELITIKNRKKIVACDPGVRKFQTTWDRTETSYMFGNGKQRQIKFLLLKRNIYQRNSDKRNYQKIQNRINHLVNELHHNTSTFLCKRYDNIILPKLEVKQLVEKKYSKEYNKAMLSLSHGKFIEQLKAKAELYNVCVLGKDEGVHERYSSRMCSKCTFINPKSAAEWKICGRCRYEVDRDVNGAKNIYFFNRHLIG